MIDLSAYPKPFTLRDGREVVLRVFEKSDEKALFDYLNSLPPGERMYFRDDVSDPQVIYDWAENIDLNRVIPLMALEGDKIVANWSLHLREHGWTRHHAHIRGINHPDWRRQGLAVKMAFELLSIAGTIDIERVVVEFVNVQKRLLKTFKAIGFVQDGLLKSWVKDFEGKYHSLHILSMQLEPAWKRMEQMILDYGTHGG